MVTLIVVLSLLGFYLLYNTSKKVQLSRTLFIERWAQDNSTAAKYSGLLLFIVGLVISMLSFGIGSGVFLFFVILMTVASLVVLLAPLKYMSYKSFSLLFVFSFAVELILK
jgi:hypothetical protein